MDHLVGSDEAKDEAEVDVHMAWFTLDRIRADAVHVDVERDCLESREGGDGLSGDADFFEEFPQCCAGEVLIAGLVVSARR